MGHKFLFVNAKAMKIIRKLRLVCGFNQTTYVMLIKNTGM